ncbi:BatA domain-containing protein [Brevundimonas bacteroides]|uniref:BatA domain-containing protein n=1 Tax=Brevundimonas bacteroides TaxID=74311 RepID=UPI0004955064|nr:BatA domain-containing protein [Brevundimonas bacteroides]
MSPALLFPLGLLALVALAIPLVIHIARRTESRTVAFAALAWLEERPKPRRRLRLDELWLLAARLLVLTLLALWLAQPVLWGAADTRPVVAIAPGIDPASVEVDDDARRVWLAPGFPEIGAGPAPAPTTELVSLIRQLDAELPEGAPLRIVAPAVIDDADAQRPILTREVDWTPAPQTRAPATLEAPAPPRLTVRFDAEGEAAVRYLRAAATAWADEGEDLAFEAAAADRPLPREAGAIVWLSASTPPQAVIDRVRQGAAILTTGDLRLPVDDDLRPVWVDAEGAVIASEGRIGRGRAVVLSRAPKPQDLPALLEPDFPDRLLSLLAPPPEPTRVAAADHAPLTGAAPYDQPPLDLRPWLALLIALVFAGERWLATRRARGPAP